MCSKNILVIALSMGLIGLITFAMIHYLRPSMIPFTLLTWAVCGLCIYNAWRR